MNSAVRRARDFALQAHADQKYGSHPYSCHLDAVAELVAPYGEQAQIAAYLHDTVEDCEVTATEIATAFGQEMADCIAVLTDEPGETRSSRKAKTNTKLKGTVIALALIVKAADRLANLRESQRDSAGSKLNMYRREHEAFKDAADRPRLCDELWNQMDSIVNSGQQ